MKSLQQLLVQPSYHRWFQSEYVTLLLDLVKGARENKSCDINGIENGLLNCMTKLSHHCVRSPLNIYLPETANHY